MCVCYVRLPARVKIRRKTIWAAGQRDLPREGPFGSEVQGENPEPGSVTSLVLVLINRPLNVPFSGRNGLGTKLAVNTRFDSMVKVTAKLLETKFVLPLATQLEKIERLSAGGAALRVYFLPISSHFPPSLGVTLPEPLVIRSRMALGTYLKLNALSVLVLPLLSTT